MTTQELTEIKAAAVKIHAAAVKAGRWDSKPEWESKLMEIVCDISRAVEADKADRITQKDDLDFCVASIPERIGMLTFDEYYDEWIAGTMEDALADAVIDILDTVEGFCDEWELHQPDDDENFAINIHDKFPVFCLDLVAEVTSVAYEPAVWLVAYAPLDMLKTYCSAHGVDLRRHVELKMKYNEARL